MFDRCWALVLGAERNYGVVIRYVGTPDQLVRLPEHYEVDDEATARLRGARRSEADLL